MKIVNKMKRNKFFKTAGTGLAGFFMISSFPFGLFRKKEINKIKVEINPLAVKRNKLGGKNV